MGTSEGKDGKASDMDFGNSLVDLIRSLGGFRRSYQVDTDYRYGYNGTEDEEWTRPHSLA